MTATTGYVGLSTTPTPRDIAAVVNRINSGKINAVDSVTIDPTGAGGTSTTLTDPRIGPVSYIGLEPLTANAAAARAGTYVSAQTNGSATITHAGAATTDRTFRFLVIG